MTSNKLNSQRQTLAHFWNNGVRSQKELHRITGIPLSTIKYNIQKLKITGDVAHRRGNGRSKKIGSDKSRELEQYIRENSSLSLRTLATKLSENEDRKST